MVEDSRELVAFMEGILSEHYQVTHRINGALGLESALSEIPDLIITDVMMPVMDGYEFCRRVKEDIRTSHIPVIMLTAKVSKENLLEGLSKGADDYLTKPFHPTELLLQNPQPPGTAEETQDKNPLGIVLTRYFFRRKRIVAPGYFYDQAL